MRPRSRRWLCGVAATVTLLLAATAASAPAPDPLVKRTLIGRSVDGRPIEVSAFGDAGARVRVLVVGCIHGTEPAGIAVAKTLEAQPGRVPPDVGLWVVDDLNPDGVAANRRSNANLVDLNRNFPYAWSYLRAGSAASWEYSGPWPLSEPEARAAARLILKVRPTLTIWYHQPLRVVDLSGGDPAVEGRYARLVGLRVRRLTRYAGSVASWQNEKLKGTTAFVVELPPGPLPRAAVMRHARAVLALAGWLEDHSTTALSRSPTKSR